MKLNGRKTARLLLLVVAFVVVPVVGVVAWRWQDGVKLVRIEVLGARHADPAAIRKLARVDTGAALYGIDPLLVADRVRRHAWVGAADVERAPSGTLRIEVRERLPVLLALTDGGAPDFFLDSTGTVMPHVRGAVFDVPLVRGISRLKQQGPIVRDSTIRDLAVTLARLAPSEAALVSEFDVKRSGEVWLYTTPIDGRGSIPVRLGTGGFGEKLDRLHAFWRQAVLPQPEQRYAWIDLRYSGQIVTQETSAREAAASDSLKPDSTTPAGAAIAPR